MSIGIGEIKYVLGRPTKAADVLDDANLSAEASAFAESAGVDFISVLDDTDIAPLVGRTCALLYDGRGGSPDAVVMCGPRYPDTLLGSDVCSAVHASGLVSHNVFTVDGLGCAGSSAAWALAQDLLTADPQRDEVVVTYGSLPVQRQRVRPPVTIIGDGAFAMTIVRDGTPTLLAHRSEIDGQYAGLFKADYKSEGPNRWKEVCTSPETYGFTFTIQSRKVLNRLLDGALADAGLSRSDVSTVLMQNVTSTAFDVYESSLKLRIDDVCRENLSSYGHLGAMDVVLNIARLLDSGTVAAGDVFAVVNTAPVGVWTVTLFQI